MAGGATATGGGLCRWVALAYLLLVPLQGLAAWRALDWAGAAESRGARQELARIAQFRQAVVSANSIAALQANLAAIQAPPLGSVDQSQSLAVLKTSLLSQLQAVEQRARASSGDQAAGASGSLPGKALDPAKLIALGKDCLRVVLLSLGLALAFAAAAQRKGSALSMRAEWRQGVEAVLEAGLLWQQERRENQDVRRLIQQEQNQQQLLLQNRHLQEQHSDERQQQGSTDQALLHSPPSTPGKPSPFAGPRGGSRKRGADADYFEALASEQPDSAGD